MRIAAAARAAVTATLRSPRSLAASRVPTGTKRDRATHKSAHRIASCRCSATARSARVRVATARRNALVRSLSNRHMVVRSALRSLRSWCVLGKSAPSIASLASGQSGHRARRHAAVRGTPERAKSCGQPRMAVLLVQRCANTKVATRNRVLLIAMLLRGVPGAAAPRLAAQHVAVASSHACAT